ncbi:sugar kinase [Jannaschia pagri]|uniref:Sugar kinase n=1 Tax=Jannaschia pagri TaxID=2829797 RepID=A0ABQ4NJ31_9RHOB|nr:MULTISPECIES: ROK family transcriptional regulator [unclassified Jannaschia]GIT90582.1 sugar kinase [Jannaschia sp. AI_61]GIT94414.1 sugar kinase [Jannaschia sp. AI_62]
MAQDIDIDLGRAATQSGVRDHNERLLLSAINRMGTIPGSQLARRLGLSAQTVSVILRSLEGEGLLTRGQPQKGRVGKPSVPIGLAPDGVFSIGLKIGRRSADLALMDFHGVIRDQTQIHFRYPMPDAVFAFLDSGLKRFLALLTPTQRQRVCGIGIAAPFEVWKWSDAIGAPAQEFAAWRDVDFAQDVSQRTGFPVTVLNDATAACMAENALGEGPGLRDYAYIFVGSFVGGGVVLGGSVFDGPHGNAGGFGPIASQRPDGTPAPLLDTASLYLLEDAISADGGDPAGLWTEPRDWSPFAQQIDPWVRNTGAAIGKALVSVCAVIDFPAVIIDGAVPPDIRTGLVEVARATLQGVDTRGLVVPDIRAGRIGENARAMGAAYAPIAERYFVSGS